MAENNNLVLTVVLVAGALLLFNGGLGGTTGYDTFSQSCGKEGSTYCNQNIVALCSGHILVPVQPCNEELGQQCVTKLVGGQTNGPQVSICDQNILSSAGRY